MEIGEVSFSLPLLYLSPIMSELKMMLMWCTYQVLVMVNLQSADNSISYHATLINFLRRIMVH